MVTDAQRELMVADMVKSLALLLLQKDGSLTMERALDLVFNSDTYAKVQNPATRLYFQSPRYVFAFLEEELRHGRVG